MNRRSTLKSRMSQFTHRRLRSAMHSVDFYLPYLFTYQMPECVGMTNTIELGPAAFVYALETRYRFFKKTYMSLHANMLAHSSRQEMVDVVTNGYVATHYLGLAGSVGYKSLLGPITLTVGSNTCDRKLHAYLNIGFEF